MSTTLREDRLESPEGESRPSRAERAKRAGRRLLAGRRLDLALLLALVTVVAFLWGRGAGKWFWLDEGIAAGISSHPFGDIPHLLRQDGSPPLYYLALNVWMSLVGSSEAQTHLLSLLFAVAVIPAALWAGWSLFGRRVGWMCALVAAVNPFLAFYSNETRMYTALALFSLLTVATFLHAFLFRRRKYVPAFVACLALVLYTHNWGLFLTGACGVALVPCWLWVDDRRRLVTDAALAFGAVAILYAPWVPTLLHQQSEDAAPWSLRPTLTAIRDDVTLMFGGIEVFVAIAVGVGFGLVALVERRWTRTTAAIAALAVMPAVVLAGGWLSSAWAHRYLAVVLAPLLLLIGLAFANAGQAGLAVLGAVAFLTAPIGTKTPPYQKSNARAVVEQMSPSLRPGDVVISPDVQLAPLLANYLPAGLRYFTTAGAVPDEHIVNWRGSTRRLDQGDPARTLPPVVDALPVGGRLLFACQPIDDTRELVLQEQGAPAGSAGEAPATPGLAGSDSTSSPDDSSTPSGKETTESQSDEGATVPAEGGTSHFHAMIKLRCRQAAEVIMGRDDLQIESAAFAPQGVNQTPVDGYLFVKKA